MPPHRSNEDAIAAIQALQALTPPPRALSPQEFVDIYIDRVKKLTIAQSAPDAADGWYDECAVYNWAAPSRSEWRDVHCYRK
jgi:hypothetical protein